MCPAGQVTGRWQRIQLWRGSLEDDAIGTQFLRAIRPRRRLRLMGAADAGKEPSSSSNFLRRARSSRSISTNSKARAWGRAPRTIACALIARTPEDIFKTTIEPGGKLRSPEPMPPPRFSSGIDNLKFSLRLVVVIITLRESFRRAYRRWRMTEALGSGSVGPSARSL